MALVKLAAYLRVSTDKQADRGLGLEVQAAAVRRFAAAAGARIVSTHRDAGVSGSLEADRRPALAAAMLEVRRGRVDGLVVAKLDRLARDLTVQEAVLARLWGDGGRVFSADTGEVLRDDPRDPDPMRRALRQMVGVFADLERGLIVARLRSARELKAADGGYSGGRPPYGWRSDGAKLVRDEREQEALALMKRRRKAGWTLQQIADELNQTARFPRHARAWHRHAIARILHREAGTKPAPPGNRDDSGKSDALEV